MTRLNIKNLPKKVLLFIGIFFITSSSFLTIFQQTVFADKGSAFTSSSNDPAETEYIQWKAYWLVKACLFVEKDPRGISNEEEQQAAFNIDYGYQPGLVYSLHNGDDDNNIRCNTISEYNRVLNDIGIKSSRAFVSELITMKTVTQDSVIKALDKYMNDNSLGGKGGSPAKLSPAAQYYYWNTVYRTSKSVAEGATGTFASCDGIISNDDGKSGYVTQIKAGPYYNVALGTSGKYEVNKYKYAYYQQDTGNTLGANDDQVADRTTCAKIIGNQISFDRAKSYRDTLNATLETSTPAAPPDPAADPAAAGTAESSCESTGGATAFFMCPIVKLLGNALSWVDKELSSLMEVDRNKFATGPSGDSMYAAWAQFRNIGLTLLIAAMLVMVISTALGVGVLDAYTVKKAFPRMVAAVIFMLLSWYICIFLIDVSNVVGRGTLGLMTSPFGDKAQSLASLFVPSAGGAIVQGGAAIGGGIVLAAALFLNPASAMIIFSWFGTAFLIMLIAFMTLIARQMFIIVLILGSPIAILSWIFPGNDKLWKIWWQTFSKLLIMFPLVMALIGSGRIFAGVISTTSGGGVESLINVLLKLSAYVLPYAFIPLTFKVAGGVFGNLVGMANDRGKGAFDRLKKSRQKNMAQLGQDTKNGELFQANNRFTRKYAGKAIARGSRVARGVASGPSNGFGIGQRGLAHDDSAAAVAAEEMMKTEAWRGNKFKGNAMRMLTHTNEKDAIADLTARGVTGDDLQQAIITARSIGYSRTSQVAAAQQMALNKTDYQDAADAMDVVNRVGGDNSVLRGSLKETVKFNSKGVGRNDLGALGDAQAGESRQQWNDRMTAEGFEGLDPYALGREHKQSYANMAEAHANMYEEAVTAYNSPGGRTQMNKDRVIATRTKLEETIKNASSATGWNAREAVGLTDRIAGADEAIRTATEVVKTRKDRNGNDITDPTTGAPVTYLFSDILGERTNLPEQGAVQGAVGSGGLARAQDEDYKRQRDREGR